MTQRGFVMLAVTVAMVLIAAIALMLTTESVMEGDLTIRAAEALEADYLAQAALQHALWQNDNKRLRRRLQRAQYVVRGAYLHCPSRLGLHDHELHRQSRSRCLDKRASA